MPVDIKNIEHRPRVVIAKNQTMIMEIFNNYPTDFFAQHELQQQTQIKYPASVHSALMALVKKGKIERTETPSDNGSRTRITYKKKCDVA